jgi:hypothetical protein
VEHVHDLDSIALDPVDDDVVRQHDHLPGVRLATLTVDVRVIGHEAAAERQGTRPRELMTDREHPHWLTLLGLGPLQPQRT